jgi:hypothetical protein
MKASSPSHVVWFVHKMEGSKKELWTRVGATWKHKSGEGMNMTLDFAPMVPGKFVILEKKEQPTGEIAKEAQV